MAFSKISQDDLLLISRERFIDSSKAGYIPFVHFFGRIAPLYQVPNMTAIRILSM
jgi:hypothetical protein